MSSFKNITGIRFERLVAIQVYEKPKPKSGYKWLCRCDCGKECVVSSSSLINGNTKSCGCLHKERTSKANRINLVGKIFGRLTVKRFYKVNKWNQSVWECECSCSKVTYVQGGELTSGDTKSCGCYKSELTTERSRSILKGLTFGNLRVEDYNSTKNKIAYWNCVCSCGGKVVVRSADLINGHTKSCGCLTESFIASEAKKYFVKRNKALTERKTLGNYKCDIYIPDNVFIEIHGEQHYKLHHWHNLQATKNGTTPEQEFQNQKYRDKVKKAYAKRHGIYIEVNLMKIKTVEEAIAYIEARLPN